MIDFSVRMMHRDITPNTLLGAETMAIFSHISRNLLLASGHSQNPGIFVDEINNILRIRQDTEETPHNFTDDTWVLYRRVGNTIQFCAGNANNNNCDSVIANLGSDKIRNFTIALAQDENQNNLNNQISVIITSCLGPPCNNDDFAAQTIIALPSHAGPSI